jgi:hypothetical protein
MWGDAIVQALMALLGTASWKVIRRWFPPKTVRPTTIRKSNLKEKSVEMPTK